MASARSFAAMSAFLARCRRPVLVSHQRPDGDALGSLAGLHRVLARRGRRPQCVLFDDPFPARYALLERACPWRRWRGQGRQLWSRADALIVLDTCARAQLEPVAAHLDAAPPTLVVDHHATRDAIGTRPGDVRIIDPRASATCLLLAEWARAARAPVDAQTATAWFAGLATDTGWFRYPSTDARTLRAAAWLVTRGAAPAEIHAAVYQREPLARLRLLARVLAGLRLYGGGRLAVMRLSRRDLHACGADETMTEDLVNEALRMGGVQAAVLLVQHADGTVRASFRSRAALDVARLASRFGGGGHPRAAGARLSGPLARAVRRVVRHTLAELDGAAAPEADP